MRWLLIFLGLATHVQADMPDKITLVAPKYWCPFACEAQAEQEGFAIEIAKHAFAEMNIKVVYFNMPYDRALREVREGSVDGVIPTFKEEAPEFIYPQQSISVTKYCFYTKPYKNWQYTGIPSLEKINFLATSGYSYSQDIDLYIASMKGSHSVELLKGEDIPQRMFKMLEYERFDALLDDSMLIDFMKANTGHGADLRVAGCLDVINHGYLALSPKHKPRSAYFADVFDKGVGILRSKNKIKAILKKYGIDDWHNELFIQVKASKKEL
ncbi:transporter substrate-binding domain-containing protein [Thalassomonas sp. RHCl1]|uniref:substrate-binding periplasmic protein n=1 Tax=Thalassomonas sp. RHCl1 TaxID=2995320 RepID=UPI00248BE7BE|nr:transporter substrate-binding domain-containing protein [Thalassomonas sp. RHCl1]